MPGCQEDPNIKDGKQIKVSHRVTTEQYEMLKTDELRDLLRVHRVRFDTASEQLVKATQEVKIWKEQTYLAEQQGEVQQRNIKVFTQPLVVRDGGFRQEQSRKREGSREALRRKWETPMSGGSRWVTCESRGSVKIWWSYRQDQCPDQGRRPQRIPRRRRSRTRRRKVWTAWTSYSSR